MGCGDNCNDSTTDTTETNTNTPAESTILSSIGGQPFQSNVVTYDAMDKMAFGHMEFPRRPSLGSSGNLGDSILAAASGTVGPIGDSVYLNEKTFSINHTNRIFTCIQVSLPQS